jgi:hypothetical protein
MMREEEEEKLCVFFIFRVFHFPPLILGLHRELHKWEPEEDVKDACELLVTILIAELTPGVDDLKQVDTDTPPVPEVSHIVFRGKERGKRKRHLFQK